MENSGRVKKVEKEVHLFTLVILCILALLISITTTWAFTPTFQESPISPLPSPTITTTMIKPSPTPTEAPTMISLPTSTPTSNGPWYDSCPPDIYPEVWPTYTLQPTYTPNPSPTCMPTIVYPTYPPLPTYTPLPTSTPYPLQPTRESEPTPTVTKLLGLRVQASGCYDAESCDHLLDISQAAGVTVLYQSVYYAGEARYPSGLFSNVREFDTLGYLIPRAHDLGIQVYPLLAVGMFYPEGWDLIDNPSVADHWFDFSDPDARVFVADIAREIAIMYDVNGILLDYIRYKSACFQEGVGGLSSTDIDQTVYGVRKAIGYTDLAASVFRSREIASWAGQDWYTWLDLDWVDYVTPMCYVEDGQLVELLDEYQESGYLGARIHPRLSLAWFDPETAKSTEEVIGQIGIVQGYGAESMSLWDNRYLEQVGGLIEVLGEGGW